MMYGAGGMFGGWGLFATILGLVILGDLILLGIWLWRKISKE